MLFEAENKTRWFPQFYGGQEWYMLMNAFKIDEKDKMPTNGTTFITNYTAKAVLSSTVRYIQFPGNIYQALINTLLKDKINTTSQVRLEKDPADGQFYYYAPCNLTSYLPLYLRFNSSWFQI